MKIGELARASGLSVDTLRYYEKIGLLPQTPRDGGGRRQFDALTLRWVEFLKRLKSTGMPLADMIAYARMREDGDGTSAARRRLLETHRLRVLGARQALDENLSAINTKIETYHALEAAHEQAGAKGPKEYSHEKFDEQCRLTSARKGSKTP